jgi:hypothetical protein
VEAQRNNIRRAEERNDVTDGSQGGARLDEWPMRLLEMFDSRTRHRGMAGRSSTSGPAQPGSSLPERRHAVSGQRAPAKIGQTRFHLPHSHHLAASGQRPAVQLEGQVQRRHHCASLVSQSFSRYYQPAAGASNLPSLSVLRSLLEGAKSLGDTGRFSAPTLPLLCPSTKKRLGEASLVRVLAWVGFVFRWSGCFSG